jgi:hypothetical protein
LPAGTYSIEFSYENYTTQTHEVIVTQSSALALDVQLERFNEGPNKPSIEGITSGDPGIVYEYIFNATDPDSDNLEYYIKWGDGDIEDWIGPYPSGEEINLSHSWEKGGKYIISAKVRDIFGEESNWETLEVTIPRSKAIVINSLLYKFLQNYPRIFSFLRNFLNL